MITFDNGCWIICWVLMDWVEAIFFYIHVFCFVNDSVIFVVDFLIQMGNSLFYYDNI